jgi:hypothetical protein
VRQGTLACAAPVGWGKELLRAEVLVHHAHNMFD